MTCVTPINQRIYQALLDKAASYPADKAYQAEAYKKAAESVRTTTLNLYQVTLPIRLLLDHIGASIEQFINQFIKDEPFPSNNTPAHIKAMNDARDAAAANKPKDVTIWPNDDEARAAFQAKLNASKAVETPTLPKTPTQPNWSIYDYTPVTYTPESPRRSRRIANKPKVQYYTKDELEEQDEIALTIQRICQRKHVTFTYDLVDEFNQWLPTAPVYMTHLYNAYTQKNEPIQITRVAENWALFVSTTLTKQYRLNRIAAHTHRAITNYCKKNNIDYTPLMDEKFAEWKADPNISQLLYFAIPSKCVSMWFSTLKKTVQL
jgi:hypothetical protein